MHVMEKRLVHFVADEATGDNVSRQLVNTRLLFAEQRVLCPLNLFRLIDQAGITTSNYNLWT